MNTSSERNPQAAQMADESMLRTLRFQIEAIWPQESRLFARYALPVDAHILDIGCGTGEATLRLAAMFPGAGLVCGVDVMPELLAVAQRQPPPIAGRMPVFEQGDGYALRFADASFDVVLNVEASHCYPDFPGFLDEVARVLKPGGRFGHADLRYRSGVEEWVTALAKHPRLRLDEMRLINPEVVRGMELNTPRYEAMVKQALPRFLHKLALDFAGVKGSRLHRDAVSGEMSYRSFKLTKLS